MTSGRILVIYGSSYGQTAKIARRIGDILQKNGLSVEFCDAAAGRPSVGPEQYTGVIVGSSLIARGHQPAIQRFVRENVAGLNRGVSAFFQVSASAGSASGNGRAAAQRVLDAFLSSTGWTPRLSASMAGAINYTKYGFLLRWYMKRASARNGGSTDTSRDHEYTDWNQVDRFASDVAALMRTANPETASTTPRVLAGA